MLMVVVEVLVNDYFGIPVPLRCRGPQSGSTAAADGSDPLRVDHGHRWLEVLFNHIFYDIRGERSRSACERDAPLVRSALHAPKKRRPTSPTAGSKRRRVESKQRRGELKRARTKISRAVE
mgnify:CR=1 FL=1